MTGDRERDGDGSSQGESASGANRPSPPRRPGTGTRQAPLPPDVGQLPWAPGQVLYAEGPVVINEGKPVTTLRVVNTADRPVQVGSHFHFAEVNAALSFDREAAWGCRLDVLSGGRARFEPGVTVEVRLVPLAGARVVVGLRGLCGGALDG